MPVVKYPRTPEGVIAHAGQCDSLITYFIKGLELGGAEEPDLSGEALDVLESFSRIKVLIGHYSALYKADEDYGKTDLRSAHETLDKTEMGV